jgi:hypothetical protein
MDIRKLQFPTLVSYLINFCADSIDESELNRTERRVPIHHRLRVLVQLLPLEVTLSPEFFGQELADVAVNDPRFGHGPQVGGGHQGALKNEPVVTRLL